MNEEFNVSEIMKDACDCHHHIIDIDNFPIDASQDIDFKRSTVEDYTELKKSLGIKRSVIAAVAAYGFDNRNVLAALKKMGSENTRAVISVNNDITLEELREYDRLGVRGVRVWNRFPDNMDYMESIVHKISALNWHMCIVPCSADDIVENRNRLSDLPCRIVFDHMAFIPSDKGEKHKAFDIMRSLILNNQAWVKISGIYYTDNGPEYSKNIELSRRFVEINPERILWGTDWPHIGNLVKGVPGNKGTDQEPISDITLVKKLLEQVPDAEIRHKILVENPEKLYGF